jgi:hypothetical protein
MSRKITHPVGVNIITPNVNFDVVSLTLTNPPVINNANTQLISRNSISGNLEIVSSASLPPPPSINIYNTDGSLTGSRAVTLNGFALTFQGTGVFSVNTQSNISIDTTSTINIGTSTALSVNIGRAAGTSTVFGTVVTPNIPIDNTLTNFVVKSFTNSLATRSVTTLPNIYTSNGSLNSDRTVTLASFNLTISGSGIFNISHSGAANINPTTTLNMGTVLTSAVGIGRVSINTTLNGNIVLANTAVNNSEDRILVRNTGNNTIQYRDITTFPNLYNADGFISSNRLVSIQPNIVLSFFGSGNSSFNINQMDNVNVNSIFMSFGGPGFLTPSSFLISNFNVLQIMGNAVTIDGLASVSIQTSTPSGTISIGQFGAIPSQITIGQAACPIIVINSLATVISSPTIQTPNIPNVQTNRILYYNGTSLSFSSVITYSAILRFVSQVSQTITTSFAVPITAGSGTLTSAAGFTLSTPTTITYTGTTPRLFELIFTGNITAAVTSQTIGISIFINGIQIPNTLNSVTLPATGVTLISTCNFYISISPGDIITIGFSRSTTDTTITYTGNLSLHTITLNQLTV